GIDEQLARAARLLGREAPRGLVLRTREHAAAQQTIDEPIARRRAACEHGLAIVQPDLFFDARTNEAQLAGEALIMQGIQHARDGDIGRELAGLAQARIDAQARVAAGAGDRSGSTDVSAGRGFGFDVARFGLAHALGTRTRRWTPASTGWAR